MNQLPFPALADPATRAALKVYERHSRRALVIGLAALVIAVIATGPGNGDPPPPLSAVFVVGFSIGPLALVAGFTGLIRSRRMKHRLGRAAWTLRRADYRIAPMGANGQPALLIQADDHGPEVVCSVPATAWRYRQLPQGLDRPLLVVGDPRRWAIVAPPDRSILLVAKRPLVPWWSRQLRKYATAA